MDDLQADRAGPVEEREGVRVRTYIVSASLSAVVTDKLRGKG